MIEAIPFNHMASCIVYHCRSGSLFVYAMGFNFHLTATATAAFARPILAIAGSSMRENSIFLRWSRDFIDWIGNRFIISNDIAYQYSSQRIGTCHRHDSAKGYGKVGIIMGIIGLILGYTMLIIPGSNKLL